jgi:hypothetical protein
MKPCPVCHTESRTPHCLSPTCTWLQCNFCEIVFSTSGITAGHFFKSPAR